MRSFILNNSIELCIKGRDEMMLVDVDDGVTWGWNGLNRWRFS